MFTADLLINALIAGVLLGGFYAAVSLGLTISFGQLNIVNIAHPAFIILGSYIAYMCNSLWGLDPILTGIIFVPVFFLIGAGAYRLYYESFERKDDEALRGLAFFFGVMFIIEVALIMVYGVDFRTVQASYIGQSWKAGGGRGADPHVRAVLRRRRHVHGRLSVHVAHVQRPRDQGRGTGSARAAAYGRRSGQDQAARLRHQHRDRCVGRRAG